jgi:hypothetical protein
MAKKRYTKKQYGGQSEFEMGLASYIRHLLDYTSGGGNWIVDGLKLPDNAHPTARWITNRIIHNFQKDSEGTEFFGKRFEYSDNAVSFLASILNQIKNHFDKDNVDSEEVKEGIYDRDSFNKHVNNAIKILDNKIAELTPKISRASSNQFGILPVETLARPIKQQNVKITMTPGILTSMVNDKTRELKDKSTADSITISKLQNILAEYKRKEDEIERKKAELERKEAEIERKKKELKNSTNTSKIAVANTDLTDTDANTDLTNIAVADTAVANIAVANTDVTDTDANIAVANTDVTDTDVANIAVTDTDANIAVANTDVVNTNNNTTKKRRNKTATIKAEEQKPEMTEEERAKAEEERAKAEKEKSIALKRAEIIANLEKAKKQQEKEEKLRKVLSTIPEPIQITTDDPYKELYEEPENVTPQEIEAIAKKLKFIKDGKVDKQSVNIYLNILKKTKNKSLSIYLEKLFSENIITDTDVRIGILLRSLRKFPDDGTINLIKTLVIFTSTLWLTQYWNIGNKNEDKYKTESFMKSFVLFEKLFNDLQKFKEFFNTGNNEELMHYDEEIYNNIDAFIENSTLNSLIDPINFHWSIFGILVFLDHKNISEPDNKYLEFYSNLEFYKYYRARK